MDRMIGCCGLDCRTCDAYLATLHDDEELRIRTARLWSQLNQAEITPAMIRCDGCRMEGAKTVFCGNFCQVRKCAMEKNLETCGDCDSLNGCAIVAAIHRNSPDALKNLGR